MDLPSDKVFKVNDQYLSRGSANISSTDIKIGLLEPGYFHHPSFIGIVPFDISKDGKVLSAKVSEGYRQTKLYIDGKPGPTIHAEAKWGPDGSYYYFQQQGENRVLFKNEQKLSSFLGFQSKLIEITGDGTVLFIAPTRLGSSIFFLVCK